MKHARTKTALRLLALLTILTLVAAGLAAAPVQAATTPGGAASAPALLQFTAGGHVLGFAPAAAWLATGSHALRVGFAGAHAVTPASDTPAATDGQAAPLTRVTYTNLWAGVSLTYEAADGAVVKSTYHLAPGADPAQIRLRYNAPAEIQADGSLSLAFQNGQMTESAPVAWQDVAGRRVPVAVSFQVRGQTVGFCLSDYDPAYPLVIDPTLTWNTFLGTTTDDTAYGIAVDGSGNVYATGYSWGTWGSPVRAYTGSVDAWVAKLASDGSLTWNTFLGGTAIDQGFGVVVDGSGNVYVGGFSGATWGSPVRAYTAGYDIFGAKLASDGSLIWHTFLGGAAGDDGGAIALDGSGNVYLRGRSSGTWGSPVRAYTAGFDIFAAKLASDGSLTWHTFLGGAGNEMDERGGIAVDGSGNVYVVGYSNAAWGASPVRAYTAGQDGWAAKLASDGSLTWHTFLGGASNQMASGIAVDGSGNVYVAGYSNVTWGTSPVRAYTAGNDGWAAKLASDGSLTWHTFLGGASSDQGFGIAVDSSGNVYVSGLSGATWGAPVRAYTAGNDVWAAAVDSSGALFWNTFLGGAGSDVTYSGQTITLDGSRNVYVAGYSSATWGAPVRAYTAGNDAWVAKMSSPTAVELASFDAAGDEGAAPVALGLVLVLGVAVAGAAWRVSRRR
ncbi:MAG: SBBP repeat-containing protein [Chloroflexi bacterium]|nr:SBBP repeat-containing protein [Chloroflexota bacterium]